MHESRAVLQFAEYLRILKDRTDHSYGTLGARLNVSASTLHRYCAGETVPVDYAIVERFARLCGAKGTELEQLHRLWIIADASREQRRHDRPARAAGEPAAAAESPGGSTDEGDVVHPVRPAASAARAAARRPGLSRLGPALAVLCVALAAVITATAIQHGAGGPPAGTGVSADRTGSPPLTLDEQPPPAQPSRTPAGRDQEQGTAPGVPAPLTVTTRESWFGDVCGHTYVLGRPVERVPAPPRHERESRSWAIAQGAVDGGASTLNITLQGRSGTAVVLHALRVELVHRRTPPRQTAYQVLPECGGGVVLRHFAVNLDAAVPVAGAKPGNDGAPISAVRFPYTVSDSDPEVFQIRATTTRCDCAWYLTLDWSSGEQEGTLRIDDRGRPFRTTSITGLPRYSWTWRSAQPQWVRRQGNT
jgi:hypothetical protein